MKKISENELAISGDTPLIDFLLLYGRQWLDDDDINAAVTVLRSGWLTTGPKVAEFERSFAETVEGM